VPEQQLRRAQVSGLLVEQCHFSAPQRVRAVLHRVEPAELHPVLDQTLVLTGRQMSARATQRPEQPVEIELAGLDYPCLEASLRFRSDLECDLALGLLLHHLGAALDLDVAASDELGDVVDGKTHEVGSSELTVDGEAEHREVARIAAHAQA